jgi:hypothetical protein
MAINLTTQPRNLISGTTYSRWNAAYNPTTFVFTLSAIPAGATSLKVEAQILDKASAVVSTHEAYAMGSIATLQVEKILQTMFTDASVYAENSLLNDTSLYVGYYVNYRESYYTSAGVLTVGSWTKSAKFFAVRGVVQIPENPNYYDAVNNLLMFDISTLHSSTGLFLTMFTDRIIPVWAGYPRDLALIIAEFSDSLKLKRLSGGVYTDTTITQDVTYPGFVARLELSTNPGHTYPWTTVSVMDAAHSATACSQNYTLENITVGSNPFYVRWRNPLGGFDYWMFEKRQVINHAASETKSTKRDLAYFSTSRSTHKVYSRKGSLSYLVGATNLSQIRWEALNSIQFSNCIEYWDGVNWIEIIPDDGVNELVNDKPAGEIEFQFFFPERQMAY